MWKKKKKKINAPSKENSWETATADGLKTLHCSVMGRKKKDLKTVFNVSQQTVSQRPCPSTYICPVSSRIIMEDKIIQTGKDPQASPPTDPCSGVQSNFPHLPSAGATESELRNQALSSPLRLGLSFHILNLFLLFSYKQERKEILLKPFTNLQKYK